VVLWHEKGGPCYLKIRRSVFSLFMILLLEGIPTLTRFRRTSDGEVIPGPEQGFDIVVGYFSADLKSSLSYSLNMHFPITRSIIAFLKNKVIFLC